MATKAVDATQLDADLESVADAIREKGGTSASMAFPDEFISAIEAISPAPDEVDMYVGRDAPTAAETGDLWMDISDESVSKNVQAYTTPVSTTSTTMGNTNMKITVSKTGRYTIYLTAGCNRNSGSYYYRLRKGSTDLVASTAISTTTGVCKVLTNQSLNSGDVLTVGLQSANTSYRAYATSLIIVEQ